MARTKRGTPPSYRRHSSGQACVTVREPDGRRREILLGNWDSPESRKEYARILNELAANQGRMKEKSGPTTGTEISVNEVILSFWRFAEQHYRGPDGSPTGELDNYRHALRPLKEMFGDSTARQFDSVSLESLQEKLMQGGNLCRNTINARVNRIRRVFKWAVRKRLIPVEVIQSLATVPGLQAGRTPAPESDGVGPVAMDLVTPVLPHLPKPVRAMVELQRLTGCRPGEVMVMRPCDIDTNGEVWTYRPFTHKNKHRGKDRIIPIGPQAQVVLKPFLTGASPEAFVFSPRAYVEAMHRRRAEQRKSKRTPSELKRKRKVNPKRKPSERYNRRSYRLAVHRACDRAFPLPERLRPRRRADGKLESFRAWRGRLTESEKSEVKVWREQHRWHPNQLRHSTATKIRARFGIEEARVILGHSRVETTQLYAERNVERAKEIMREIG